MNDNDKVSEVLIPISLDRREACDRRRFIAGASAALAAVALSSRQAASQDTRPEQIHRDIYRVLRVPERILSPNKRWTQNSH